jgi:hypothetical protein
VATLYFDQATIRQVCIWWLRDSHVVEEFEKYSGVGFKN